MARAPHSSTHEDHDHKKRLSKSLLTNWIIIIALVILTYYFILRNIAN